MNYLFYDDETTGSKQIIIQVGCVLTNQDGEEIERFQSYIDPQGEKIDQYVSRNVHHITDKMVRGQANFVDIWEHQILPMLDDAVLVAHGAKSADLHHIQKTLAKSGQVMTPIRYIDSQETSKDLWWVPEGNTRGCSLATLTNHYGVSSDGHHDALADAAMTSKIFFEMLEDGAKPEIHILQPEPIQPTLNLEPSSITICVTGDHPSKLWGYDYTNPQYQKVMSAFKNIVEDLDASSVISGLGIGFDQIAADYAAQRQHISLIAALPCSEQNRRWPTAVQEHYSQLLDSAARTYTAKTGEFAPYKAKIRDQWMVKKANAVVALVRPENFNSNNCIEYAIKIGRPIYVLNPDDLQKGKTPEFKLYDPTTEKTPITTNLPENKDNTPKFEI